MTCRFSRPMTDWSGFSASLWLWPRQVLFDALIVGFAPDFDSADEVAALLVDTVEQVEVVNRPGPSAAGSL